MTNFQSQQLSINKLLVTCLVLFLSIPAKAQFSSISLDNKSGITTKIVQIDYYDESTIVHLQCNNTKALCATEDVYLESSDKRKYQLLNSFNLPYCDRTHLPKSKENFHNFSLEFEKMPVDTGHFNIINLFYVGSNLNQIKIDTTAQLKNLVDFDNFLGETPVRETWESFKDGEKIITFRHKGVEISVDGSISKSYGKYYQFSITIINSSGREITFNPELINVSVIKNDVRVPLRVLTRREFLKKVQNQQALAAAAAGMSQYQQVQDASRKTTTTVTQSNSTSNTNSTGRYNGSSYGSYSKSGSYSSSYGSYSGNYSGSYSGRSTTNSSTNTISNSTTYDGAAAYRAQQDINRQNQARNQNFSETRSRVNAGYATINTIADNSEYRGYVNAKYKKGDKLIITVAIGDERYLWPW